MIRSILACTVVAMVGFAKSAYAATYADYNLDTSVGASYASPASIIAQSYGTVGDLKGVCDGFPDCIAVLYRECIPGRRLCAFG